MKKYYFESVFRSLIYLFISLFLIAIIVLCFYVDELHAGVIFVLTFLSISVVAILFWFGFSLSMRIQIDYNRRELYIIHPCLLKRINFDDVISIQIIEFNQLSFDFIITTKNITKKIAYSRYYKKKVTKERVSIINELKHDLMNISTINGQFSD